MLPNSLAKDVALGANGSYGGSRDAIKHCIYDTRSFGTTISDYAFFTQGINTTFKSTLLKTKNETNLLDGGKLPNGQTFLIKRIGIALISVLPAANTVTPTIIQAFINLVQSSVFELIIAGREFDFQYPGSAFVPSLSVHGISAAATGTAVRAGDAIASGWISIEEAPIFLGPMVSFQLKHTLSNPDSNVVTVLNAGCVLLNGLYSTMQVRMEGTLTRAK